MSRNGSGTYTLPAGNPVVTGTTIASTWANTTLSDIASALTDSVAADGQTTMTGQLDMGNNKVINLANATVNTDAVTYGQMTTDIAAAVAAVTGRVRQVVSATFNTRSDTTSSSFVNTSVTASITPSNTSSKILVLVSASCFIVNYGNEQNLQVWNGTAQVAGSYRINKVLLPTEGINQENYNPIAIVVVDSPNTTSSVTYTVRQRCTNGSSALVGFGSGDTGSSCIILMEIL
jgi:hypothetical protein